MPIIYKISCPNTNSVVYVGKTSRALKTRLEGHKKHGSLSMKNWLITLNGKSPIIDKVENVSKEEAIERELFWIKHYTGIGAPLLNMVGVYHPQIKERTTKDDDGRNGKKPSPDLTNRLNKLIKDHTIVRVAEKTEFSYRTLKKISDGIDSVMPHVLEAFEKKLETVKFD